MLHWFLTALSLNPDCPREAAVYYKSIGLSPVALLGCHCVTAWCGGDWNNELIFTNNVLIFEDITFLTIRSFRETPRKQLERCFGRDLSSSWRDNLWVSQTQCASHVTFSMFQVQASRTTAYYTWVFSFYIRLIYHCTRWERLNTQPTVMCNHSVGSGFRCDFLWQTYSPWPPACSEIHCLHETGIISFFLQAYKLNWSYFLTVVAVHGNATRCFGMEGVKILGFCPFLTEIAWLEKRESTVKTLI